MKIFVGTNFIEAIIQKQKKNNFKGKRKLILFIQEEYGTESA
jgi:hypothetical protein